MLNLPPPALEQPVRRFEGPPPFASRRAFPASPPLVPMDQLHSPGYISHDHSYPLSSLLTPSSPLHGRAFHRAPQPAPTYPPRRSSLHNPQPFSHHLEFPSSGYYAGHETVWPSTSYLPPSSFGQPSPSADQHSWPSFSPVQYHSEHSSRFNSSNFTSPSRLPPNHAGLSAAPLGLADFSTSSSYDRHSRNRRQPISNLEAKRLVQSESPTSSGDDAAGPRKRKRRRRATEEPRDILLRRFTCPMCPKTFARCVVREYCFLHSALTRLWLQTLSDADPRRPSYPLTRPPFRPTR